MKRIEVSESWRMMQCNSTFKMQFDSKVDMEKAYAAMEAAVRAIDTDSYYKDYYDLWLQDLKDCCEKDEFEIDSALNCMAFNEFIPAMCKAVAEALPLVHFSGNAYYNDLKCFWVDEFEFSYKDKRLSMKETFMDDDCGYFCPDCGCFVLFPDAVIDCDEIACDDCDEVHKITELKYVPPEVTETEYIVK